MTFTGFHCPGHLSTNQVAARGRRYGPFVIAVVFIDMNILLLLGCSRPTSSEELLFANPVCRALEKARPRV